MDELYKKEMKNLLNKFYVIDDIILKKIFYTYSDIVKLLGIGKCYNLIIEDVAKLFLEMAPNKSVHEFFYLYLYMLNNGYFSINNFKYMDITDVVFDGRCIVSGVGNCRHISGMYNDILKQIKKLEELNFISYLADVYLFDDVLELEKLKTDNEFKIFSNHLLNLVSENGHYYFQDATNNFIFSSAGLMNGEFKFLCNSILKNERMIFLPVKLKINASLSNKNLFNLLMNMNNSDKITASELIKIRDRMYKIFINNLDVFASFHDRNLEKMDKIYKKLKMFGSLNRDIR